MTNVTGSTEVKLTLTLDQVNVVLAALDELPHRIAKGLAPQIQVEAQRQIQALQAPSGFPEPGEPQAS